MRHPICGSCSAISGQCAMVRFLAIAFKCKKNQQNLENSATSAYSNLMDTTKFSVHNQEECLYD